MSTYLSRLIYHGKFLYLLSLPLILAFVLGSLLEDVLRQSLIISNGSFSIFMTRQISAGFFIVAIFLPVSPLISGLKKSPREERLIDLG